MINLFYKEQASEKNCGLRYLKINKVRLVSALDTTKIDTTHLRRILPFPNGIFKMKKWRS